MSHLLKGIARLLRLPVEPLPPAPELGVRKGRLTPCPNARTCASSYASDPGRALPPLPAQGGHAAALNRLQRLIEQDARGRVVERRPYYLRAVFTLPVFGFEDDVEFFWSEAEQVIHYRSASRVGNWDLGVNRRRLRRLRRAYLR